VILQVGFVIPSDKSACHDQDCREGGSEPSGAYWRDDAIMVRALRWIVPLGLCVFGGLAGAQEPSSGDLNEDQIRQLEQKLSEYVQIAEANDIAYEITTGLLSAGEAGATEITLEKGQIYQFAAVCDEACSDIDMTVRGPDGVDVQWDRFADAAPAVEVVPKEDGAFILEVVMKECANDRCALAVMGARVEE
jgi:hypothetical protein